jgi:hypothetical protein
MQGYGKSQADPDEHKDPSLHARGAWNFKLNETGTICSLKHAPPINAADCYAEHGNEGAAKCVEVTGSLMAKEGNTGDCICEFATYEEAV